uniref:uncharacterized protein LOC100181779 n=1 Tax=Ciona intestinalis TaxID=7719 RepID=UPI000EF4804A|nr:uncharacterized protein LOC100181779 [Ciona intestinalis]|eukprot:XP_026689882.1 uncharacterized protein LOC100181779 [Ciona intestinalis]
MAQLKESGSFANMKMTVCKAQYNMAMQQVIRGGKFIAWSTLKSRHTNIKESIVNEHCQGDAALKDQMLQALNLEYKTIEQRNQELEEDQAKQFLGPLNESMKKYCDYFQNSAEDGTLSREGFDSTHSKAKQAAFNDLRENMPVSPPHMVEQTEKKLSSMIRDACNTFRQDFEKQTSSSVSVESFTKPLEKAIVLYRTVMKEHATMGSPKLPFEEMHKQAKQLAKNTLVENLPQSPVGLVNTTKEKLNELIQQSYEEYRAAQQKPEDQLAFFLMLAGLLGQDFMKDFQPLIERSKQKYDEIMNQFMKDGKFISWLTMRRKHESVVQECITDVSNKLGRQQLKEFSDKIDVVLEEKFNEFRKRNSIYEEKLREDAMGKIVECVSVYKSMIRRAIDNPLMNEKDFEHIHQHSKAAAFERLEKSSIIDKEKFSHRLNGAIKQEQAKALEVLKRRRPTTPNTAAMQQAVKSIHDYKIGEITVQVANCGITDLTKSNIIVNSVGPDFELSKGQVSAILLRRVGPQLQTECTNNPKFSTESYRITTGGNLCDHIVHYVLPNEEYRIEESIMELLEKCDNMEAITVVMPVLGSGNRGVPVDKCARFLWAAICLLNSYRKPTYLNCIKIPAYDVKVFNGLVKFFDKPPRFLGFPSHWGNVSRGTTEVKQLTPDSSEFNDVVAAFKKSNPPVNEILQVMWKHCI